jgi:hypothetical protein
LVLYLLDKSADFSRLRQLLCRFFYFRDRKFQPALLTGIRVARGCPVRTLWSAAACRRFSVVKSALQQSIRTPSSSQEKQLHFDSYVNP